MLMKRVVALSILVLCLSGCSAWRYTSLPSSHEFSKPLATLLTEYPELRECEPTFGRYMATAVWDMPYAEDLVDKWGEPDYTRLSWWNLMPFTVVPPFHPMTVWRWYKADKEIDVLVDHPLAFGYGAHVWTLEVSVKRPD